MKAQRSSSLSLNCGSSLRPGNRLYSSKFKITNIQFIKTILGASGQIAEELVRELHRNYTTEIRLVSRKPKKVNSSDQLFAANLLDAKATDQAVKGSTIVDLTIGLPMNSVMWEEQFPVMMRNF